MDSVYRVLVPIALWLGIAAFALALIMMIGAQPFLFGLTPGGILRGAQSLTLLAVGGYCASRTRHRT